MVQRGTASLERNCLSLHIERELLFFYTLLVWVLFYSPPGVLGGEGGLGVRERDTSAVIRIRNDIIK